MTFYRHELTGPIAAGDLWTVTMHTNGSVDINAAHAAWTTCATALANAFKTYWPTQTKTSGIKTFALDPNKGKNTALVQSALAITGSVATSQGPPSATVTVGLRTNVPTRAGRGRMYFPGLSNTNLDTGGMWLPATITALAPLVGTAIKNMSLTSQVVVYHRYHIDPDTNLPVAPSGTNVNTITIGVVPNTQRRRVNKVSPAYTSAPAT